MTPDARDIGIESGIRREQRKKKAAGELPPSALSSRKYLFQILWGQERCSRAALQGEEIEKDGIV